MVAGDKLKGACVLLLSMTSEHLLTQWQSHCEHHAQWCLWAWLLAVGVASCCGCGFFLWRHKSWHQS